MTQRNQGRREVAIPSLIGGAVTGTAATILLAHAAPVLLSVGIHVAILAGVALLTLTLLRCLLVALVKTAQQWPHQRAINMKYTGKSCFWKV